jgi:hypothetical protein
MAFGPFLNLDNSKWVDWTSMTTSLAGGVSSDPTPLQNSHALTDTANTNAFSQLAGGYPPDGICRTLACHPISFVHNLLLDELNGLFAILVQPNGQGLLDSTTAQPDNRFSAFIHETPREQFALALSFALLEE